MNGLLNDFFFQVKKVVTELSIAVEGFRAAILTPGVCH